MYCMELSANSKHFRKVTNNIQTIVNIIGRERVRIGYLVVPPYNHQRELILEATELAQGLNVAHIAFRPAYGIGETTREMWLEAADAILEMKKIYREGFILGGASGSWPNMLGMERHPTGVCRTRPLVLVVKADGTIPTCFLYRERTEERPAIGLITEGFAKVWFSDVHRDSIRAFDRVTCPEVCKLYRTERALDALEKGASIIAPSLTELDDPYFI